MSFSDRPQAWGDEQAGRPLSERESYRTELGFTVTGPKSTEVARFADVDYLANHKRVRRERGKAKLQDCVDCGKRALDWSYVHDSDPSDVNNYQARCRGCHIAYDGHGHIGNNSNESINSGKRYANVR